MGILDSIPALLKGVQSVIGASGAVQNTISDSVSTGIERALESNAVADGAEHAFKRIQKPLEHLALKISFIFISLLFVVWGVALFVDNFAPYHGLGFVAVGAIFGLAALHYLGEKN